MADHTRVRAGDLSGGRRPLQRRGAAATGVLRGRVRARSTPGDVSRSPVRRRTSPGPRSSRPISCCDAMIDDEIKIRSADHPRLYSTGLTEPGVIRGVPTYIPKALDARRGSSGGPHGWRRYQDGDVQVAGPSRAASSTPPRRRHARHGSRTSPQPAHRRGARRRSRRCRRAAASSSSPTRSFGEPTGVNPSSSLMARAGAGSSCDLLGWDQTSANRRCSSSGWPSVSTRQAERRPRARLPERRIRPRRRPFLGHTREHGVPGGCDGPAGEPVTSEGSRSGAGSSPAA